MPQVRNHDTNVTVIIALGGNLPTKLGNPVETLARAALDLSICGLELRQVSPFFRTPCFPSGAGPDYVNAAAILSTNLSPQDILAHLHRIEARYDRERTSRWANRTLDLDLLAVGECILPDGAEQKKWMELDLTSQTQLTPDQLVLPHPRMHQRAFVLVPLARIAPNWRHPVLGLCVSEMLSALPESQLCGIEELRTS